MSEGAPSAAATDPSPAVPAPPLGLGERLRAERERRGLSLQKAADDMHLDDWVIAALESGDYQRIGPAVFAKGHLKKYAANLGLPVAEFLDGFDGRKPGAPPGSRAAAGDDVVQLADDSPAMSRAGILVVIVVAVLAAGLWVWKPWSARADASRIVDSATVEPDSPPAAAAPAATVADEREQVAAASVQTVAAEVPIPAATAAAKPAVAMNPAASGPGAGHARLRLSFSADSRVEVRDAAGKLVFSGIGQANSVKQLSGIAPMHVYLSESEGVQLEINDRAVAIGAKFLSGTVAHFDAGADGVLRRDSAAVAEQRPRG